MHDFGYAYIGMHAHSFPIFFQVFKIFLLLNFSNLLLYTWPSIYLLALEKDRFFTVYISFKETLFLIFHRKYLINISPCVRALVNLGRQ